MNERIKLDDYLKKNPFTDKVAHVDKPHPVLENNRPIDVYYECTGFSNDNKSRFILFDDGEFVSNAIWFPCDVAHDDIYAIANEMIQELLDSSDFTDLDRELEGKCACEEFEGTYKKCDECPRYSDKENGCMGAIYSIPPHKNWWELEKKWKEIYGEGSDNHKKYVANKMIGYMNSFMWACGDRKDLIQKVLEYGKQHTNNKCKKLFK
jgi:hypothetical protein